MQRRSLLWVILGGMVVVLVAVVWRNKEVPRTREPLHAANVQPRHEPVPALGALNFGHKSLLPPTNSAVRDTNISHNTPLLAYRVKNTQKPIGELIYSDSAILLRNALFDAAEAAPLEIPPHLKSQGDPGSFVVQARGPIEASFHKRLSAAGAKIISYIPNNAYLVQAPQAVANQLAAAPEVQSILPWEPYFKLDLSLLRSAVEGEPFRQGERVSVVVFPGERESGLKALESLGARLVGEDRSPFGHQIIVEPASDSLAALAQLPIVQSIEPHRGRVLANDISRVRVSVATNTLAATPNYLGLSGTNVLVSINDTGVEESHPALENRVFGVITDPDGHGTHVAGTIAGDGAESPPSAPGSTNGANFRGIAPAAKLFSQQIDLITGPLLSDAFLQESVGRSNILVSNNSWAYPLSEYNQNAASYDAAVRDSLPGIEGSTPVIYVFAAGNVGNSDFDGRGSRSDQIESPGTAKNVITITAIENMRELTNRFQIDGETNAWFYPETDSEDQVAFYSARGNVGVGLEGEFGRFKPDLAAPGSWIISCRATNWNVPTNLVSFNPSRDVDEFIERRGTNLYFRTIPDNATGFLIRVLRNSQSPGTMPRLNIHTNIGDPPTINAANFADFNQILISPVTPGQFHFAIVNTNSLGVHFDLLTAIVTTNDFGDYFKELGILNTNIAPYYRFESGTSMAAGVASGTVALMQEFFEQRLGRTNSPALMKALLINGARSLPCVGCDYDLQVRKPINDQGWGSIRLTNSIPRALDLFRTQSNSWPIIMFDQDPNTALATGEAHTYNIQLNARARFEPLMVTLVWTDPPGNPVASTKLVNDLDLIVTNITSGGSGEYYVGNHIPQGSDFNEPVFLADSNTPPFDVVNNVENVFINDPLAQRYSITVRARRVNVNAVTPNTNGIRQDYALVISSGNSSLTNTFNTVTFPIVRSEATDSNPYLQTLSNKVAKLDQRVGANSPQLEVVTGNQPGPSHGSTNQWNFYVFNNTNASHTNIAFITFLAPDLSVPRIREADIDLYVTRDPALTNLEPAVVNGATKSLTRGGTEMVILTDVNAGTGEYFVGVKSEDQQAASFAIFVIAQEKPFGQRGEDGNIPLDFFPLTSFCIPDGSPEIPGGARFFAIVADPLGGNVRRVILTNDVDHQLGGDLLGMITKSGDFSGVPPTAVLNNHRQFIGFERSIYDDSGEDDIPFSRTSDGPGSLRDFEGRSVNGLWQFTMIDNTPFHTGCVAQIVGMIEPQEDTNTLGDGILLRLGARRWRYTAIDVPVGVTNVIVYVRQEPAYQLPVEVYLRRNVRPTLTQYDKFGRVDPPGGTVEHSRYDLPSLQSGRYHIGIYNPNDAPVELRMRIEFQYSLRPLETFSYLSSPSARIPDDLRTNFVIGVTNARNVADVKVGVRIDHPRLSDLVLHLVSPEGTRVLLTENRGLALGTNYGHGVPRDFIVPFNSNGDSNEFRTTINTSNRQGIINITYDFRNLPDNLRVYYEGRRIFDSGMVNLTGTFSIPYGPGISTSVELVVNEGGQSVGTLWFMDVSVTGPWNYAIFTDQATLGGPIKFAFPPFYREPTNIVVFSNSFENVFAGIYPTNVPPAVTTVDDWAVRSNSVAILTDTNVACTGSNFLALSHGMISRGVTNLVPGHEYIINFGQRKISSSPTQQVYSFVPTEGTPFNNISPGPPPAGTSNAIAVPKLRLCPGQEVTLMSTGLLNFNGVLFDPRGDTNNLHPDNGLPRYALIGCWSSHPTVLDQRTRASMPFYIGGGYDDATAMPIPIVISAPNEPGDYYLFLGANEDPTATGAWIVDLRWAQCQLASADYLVGNTPVKFNGAWRTNWAGESLGMLANPTTTNLAFRADHNSTILLDCVIIDELVPSIHYLSEEPLAHFKSQTAYGNWTLEVTDNRVGPPINDTNFPTLLSWSLNFVYEDGPNPIPLTNGIPFNYTVRGADVHYFVVNVPLEVDTNTIRFGAIAPSAGIELLYNPFGLPEGAVPPDPIFPRTEAQSPFGVSTAFPPAAGIVPGRQYFLAIRNVDPNTVANDYRIRVDFENIPITSLTPGIPASGTIQPLPGTFLQTRANSFLAVTNMHYYYFDVGSSGDPAITNVMFDLTSSDGDNVHLVASRALPVVDLFPRPTFYEYHSTDIAQADTIIITSNSIPVRLGPGRWYLGVYNAGTNSAAYNLTATESRAQVFNLTYLDVGASHVVVTNFSVTRGNRLTSFYHFITHDTNAAVLFEIFDLTNDVDLIVRRSDLPSRDLYDFSFLSTGPSPFTSRLPRNPPNTGYEPIPIRTNIFVPTLGVNTNWYFAIANRGASLVSTGMLCVKIFTNINPIVGCVFNSRFQTVSNDLQICWDAVGGTSYDVESTTDLINWTTIITNAPPPCATLPATLPPGPLFFRIRAY